MVELSLDNTDRSLLFLIFALVGLNTYSISGGKMLALIIPAFGLFASVTLFLRDILSDEETPSADNLESGDIE